MGAHPPAQKIQYISAPHQNNWAGSITGPPAVSEVTLPTQGNSAQSQRPKKEFNRFSRKQYRTVCDIRAHPFVQEMHCRTKPLDGNATGNNAEPTAVSELTTHRSIVNAALESTNKIEQNLSQSLLQFESPSARACELHLRSVHAISK